MQLKTWHWRHSFLRNTFQSCGMLLKWNVCDSVSSDYQGTVLLHSREEQWRGSYFGTAVKFFLMISISIQNLSKYVSWLHFVLSEMFRKCCWLWKSIKDVKVRCPSVAWYLLSGLRSGERHRRQMQGQVTHSAAVKLLPRPSTQQTFLRITRVWCHVGKLGIMAMNSFHFLPA